jgi:DNA-binding NarL/FixJ family response regulator
VCRTPLVSKGARFLLYFQPAKKLIRKIPLYLLCFQRTDLILMDIRLPSLNGIEAARRIHESVPAAKIIFLSEESSVDVVQEAMSFGACGYVFKSMAASDLVTAVETVLSGLKFVSI